MLCVTSRYTVKNPNNVYKLLTILLFRVYFSIKYKFQMVWFTFRLPRLFWMDKNERYFVHKNPLHNAIRINNLKSRTEDYFGEHWSKVRVASSPPPPPPPCWMFAPLRFYYIYCNVQHVALAPPPPLVCGNSYFAPPPPLEQNLKCSPESK